MFIPQHFSIADNTPLSGGRFAVPMAFWEFCHFSTDELNQIVRSPRKFEPIMNQERIGINGDYNRQTSIGCGGTGHSKSGVSPWRPIKPLINPVSGISNCHQTHSDVDVKCAITLVRWFKVDGISEFRTQNALRKVSGVFSLKEGVEGAVSILLSHGAIAECPFPAFRYPCKRPSPWYVVNPNFMLQKT